MEGPTESPMEALTACCLSGHAASRGRCTSSLPQAASLAESTGMDAAVLAEHTTSRPRGQLFRLTKHFICSNPVFGATQGGP